MKVQSGECVEGQRVASRIRPTQIGMLAWAPFSGGASPMAWASVRRVNADLDDLASAAGPAFGTKVQSTNQPEIRRTGLKS
jgi:hypothetical protein